MSITCIQLKEGWANQIRSVLAQLPLVLKQVVSEWLFFAHHPFKRRKNSKIWDFLLLPSIRSFFSQHYFFSCVLSFSFFLKSIERVFCLGWDVCVPRTCHCKVWKTILVSRRYSSHSWTCFITTNGTKKSQFWKFLHEQELKKKVYQQVFKVVITNKIFVHCVLKRNFVSFFSLCVKKKSFVRTVFSTSGFD